jgi:rare lipoprotein A
MDSSEGYQEHGVASWYGTKFHGRRTSSGERYDMYAMTAAHKTLPLPAFVRVTNLQNGRAVVVKVNDRGPFHGDRIIDLSYAAATKLGVVDAGTAPVEVVALPPHQTLRGARTAAPGKADGGVHQVQEIPRGNMYLQVGAFSERSNAQRLLVELDNRLPGRVRIHEVQGTGAAYRVRVGPLSTAETHAVRRDLGALGVTDAIVVFEERM